MRYNNDSLLGPKNCLLERELFVEVTHTKAATESNKIAQKCYFVCKKYVIYRIK